MANDDKNRLKFDLPEGFALPEGTRPDEEFNALATLKVDEDGKVCLLAIDGADIYKQGAKASEEDEEEPTFRDSISQNLTT